MDYQIGQFLIGKIVKIKPFAFFLEFEDGTQGLLHISELSDSFIRDIEKFGSIGDSLKVKVIEKDPNNGFLRVSFKQVPQQESFSTHTNSKRSSIEYENSEFDALKEKLPEWITNTMEKMEK